MNSIGSIKCKFIRNKRRIKFASRKIWKVQGTVYIYILCKYICMFHESSPKIHKIFMENYELIILASLIDLVLKCATVYILINENYEMFINVHIDKHIRLIYTKYTCT